MTRAEHAPVEATHSGIAPHIREIFARARNPHDPIELARLYIGAVESDLGGACLRHDAAASWRSSRRLRQVDDEEILTNRSTVRWVKELFNHYFRDDLYGALRRDDTVILSSGSLDERVYGLPASLKRFVIAALDRDWYGYSDSRGRLSSRRAVAEYENTTVEGQPYDEDWVALTMGGTFSIACLADFLLGGGEGSGPAICAIPNYPPLVEGVAKRVQTRLVPTDIASGRTDITPVVQSLRRTTPLVLLQTVTNPTGTRVSEDQIALLIRAAAPSTIVVLDEAHECLGGDPPRRCAERAWPNVVRVTSLSKAYAVPGMKLGWIVGHPDVLREYYEYASTTYGGPPSLFYLLIEMIARFARWQVLSMDPPEGELAEMEPGCYFSRERVVSDYIEYVAYRRVLEAGIVAARERTTAALAHAGCSPTRATHSLNVVFRPPGCTSSYTWFRHALATERVSCFPDILTFGLQDDRLRITVGRRPDDLGFGLDRILSLVERGS